MGKPEYKSWLELGKKMATILHKMSQKYGNIEVEAVGNMLADAKGLVNAGVAYGFVQQDAKDANLINALEILKGNGAEVRY